MSTPLMDPNFANSLRRTLIHQVDQRPPRLRKIVVGTGALGIIVAGGGVAVAAGAYFSQPGASVDVAQGDLRVQTHVGSGRVDLGVAPDGSDVITGSFTCLSAATFVFADGSTVTCSDSDLGSRDTVPISQGLEPGQTYFSVLAPEGAEWSVAVSYGLRESSEWAINDQGQTYGVPNANGFPDLVAVIASNGAEGYVYSVELNGPDPSNPGEAAQWSDGNVAGFIITVYQADGVTPLGEYEVTG